MAEEMPWSRRKALLELPQDAPVRIWTVQHPAALEAARLRGWLSGDHGHITSEDDLRERQDGTGFWRAYEWMRDRMAERISGFSGELPVWAYLKRPSAKPLEDACERNLRITAVVPRRRILLSDEDAWLSVLDGRHYEATGAEFEADGAPVPAFGSSPTWERVFDLSPRTGEWARWRGEPTLVQACVDRIHLGEIVALPLCRASRPGGCGATGTPWRPTSGHTGKRRRRSKPAVGTFSLPCRMRGVNLRAQGDGADGHAGQGDFRSGADAG